MQASLANIRMEVNMEVDMHDIADPPCKQAQHKWKWKDLNIDMCNARDQLMRRQCLTLSNLLRTA